VIRVDGKRLWSLEAGGTLKEWDATPPGPRAIPFAAPARVPPSTRITALSGAAYKMEINLSGFYRRHLAKSLGGNHLPLLAGFAPPTGPDPHAVVSIDWWYPPTQLAEVARPPEDHARVVDRRLAAEAAAKAVLSAQPKRLRAFETLLAETQRLVPLREEQTREWTIAWPVMRRAVVRMGEALVEEGVIGTPDDIFFLTKSEALAALAGEPLGATVFKSTPSSHTNLDFDVLYMYGKLTMRAFQCLRSHQESSKQVRVRVCSGAASPVSAQWALY